ncbi:MAG: hypothetical protein R3A44_19855 [Caldilineaceae bacterium]
MPATSVPSVERFLFIAIGAVAAAGLMFEITITRLFSLFFQYHYAYLALSLAVLGISLGAALAYFVQPSESTHPRRWLARLLTAQALLLAAAALIMPRVSTPLLSALVAMLPFMAGGLFSVSLFTQYAPHSGRLYAADLGGASVGVIVVLLLLSWTSPINIVLLLAGGVAVMAWRLAQPWPTPLTPSPAAHGDKQSGSIRAAELLTTVVCGGLLLLNLWTGWLDYAPARVANPPRDKTMLTLLHDAGTDGRIARTVWSPFARVDVVETADANHKFVFTDGGAGSLMTRFDGDLHSVAELTALPDYAPFALTAPKRPLILGAGAGKDILMALLGGADEITALEVNPAVAAATRLWRLQRPHLDHPQVKLSIGDARTFVERSADQYDLIYLNLVYTQAADLAGQAQVENYIFTTQAFESYLRHLTPGGQAALVTHNALEGSRAALTALAALEQMGIPPAQALDQLALWMTPNADPTLRTSVLLLSQTAFSAQQLADISTIMQQRNMQPLFMPGQFEMAFEPLRKGGALRDFVVADAAYDLSPTSDDSPFFFKLDHGIPTPVRQALWAALALLVIFLLLAGAMRVQSGAYGAWWLTVGQSAALGAGFMLFETSLIQRLQLLLGYPVLTLAAVLGALLMASGAGSWFSQRRPANQLAQRAGLTAAAATLLMLLYWVLLPWLVRLLLPMPLVVRLLAVVIFAAPAGFLLGQIFPSLLRMFSHHWGHSEPVQMQRRGLAVLWGINGATSVVGSTLAVVLAMSWGFGAAMLVGAVCYAAFWGLNQMSAASRAG